MATMCGTSQCDDLSRRQTWPMSKALPPLAALPSAPACARAFIQSELSLWRMGDLAEHAELVISELVTNALQASAKLRSDSCVPLIRICMFADGIRLVVEVWDEADGIPEIRDACEFEESGRGLALVNALCDSWGWKSVPGGNCKCVWAELVTAGPLRSGRPFRPSAEHTRR